jgi:hypothetical protein
MVRQVNVPEGHVVKGSMEMKTSIVAGLMYTLAFVGLSVPAAAAASATPAPILAAGIPAFMAVGGGALIARWRNRKK